MLWSIALIFSYFLFFATTSYYFKQRQNDETISKHNFIAIFVSGLLVFAAIFKLFVDTLEWVDPGKLSLTYSIASIIMLMIILYAEKQANTIFTEKKGQD